MNRLLVLTVIITLPVIVFAEAASNGMMDSSNSKKITALDLILGAQDIHKIKYIVDEFLELRNIRNTPQAEVKAQELDKEISQLVLVEKYCTEKPSSLHLAHSSYPYKELQKICPKLNSLEFSKAISIWKNFI